MKISLIFEKKGKECRIPLTRKELGEIYDFLWSVWPAKGEKFLWDKKSTKAIASFQNKLMHAIHDILDGGRVYEWKDGKTSLLKEPHYVRGKPRWKSGRK
jgi:hypothetical protein